MKIDHVAMYVEDLEKARFFFEKYFEAKSNSMYHNTITDFKSYFLSFKDGSRLEIMNNPNLIYNNKDILRTGYSHIAFSVGSKEKVNLLTEQLLSDGYTVLSGPRITGDGYYESVIISIEENLIEITI